MNSILRHAWKRFGLITSIIGDFQGRLFAMVFYFSVLVPFGIGSRLSSDPLRLKAQNAEWLDRPETGRDLESAQRQG